MSKSMHRLGKMDLSTTICHSDGRINFVRHCDGALGLVEKRFGKASSWRYRHVHSVRPVL